MKGSARWLFKSTQLTQSTPGQQRRFASLDFIVVDGEPEVFVVVRHEPVSDHRCFILFGNLPVTCTVSSDLCEIHPVVMFETALRSPS